MNPTTNTQEQTYREKLSSLGFTSNEAKVFIVLLKGDLMSASEIAKEAGIRRTDIYDMLKKFVQKGYCNEIDTNRILMYQMIDPTTISDKIIYDINRQSKSQISETADLFENLKTLFRSNQNDESDKINIELVRGFNMHRDAKYIELINNSTEEILSMNRIEFMISSEFNKASESFINRGGSVRSIYEIAFDYKIEKEGEYKNAKISDLFEILKGFENKGEQVRIIDKKITNLAVFDRKIVYLHIHDKDLPRFNRSDIIIRNKEFAEYMAGTFEFQWESSITLEFLNKQVLEYQN
jgi:sugar-specific transcriptional regulator TrmB